jgi:vacuolar-type H+-ATPase subunit H
MARLSILDRFRPVGAPGPAGPVGVPAVEEPGHAAELAPVFAALAPDIEACRRLVDDARRGAEDDLSRARDEAAAIVARARLESDAVRADAAAAVEHAASDQDERTRETARREAARLRATGTAGIPDAVGRVIDRLLADQLTS